MYNVRSIKRTSEGLDTWLVLMTKKKPNGNEDINAMKAFGPYDSEKIALAAKAAIVETLQICGKIVK